jgi:hypothetical protein
VKLPGAAAAAQTTLSQASEAPLADAAPATSAFTEAQPPTATVAVEEKKEAPVQAVPEKPV